MPGGAGAPSAGNPRAVSAKPDTNVGSDIGNWFGDVEQWATDAAHRTLQFGKATGGWVGRNFSETGLDNTWHDTLGGLNTTKDIINGIGGYLGIPNSITGNQGQQLTWQDTLQGLGMYDRNSPITDTSLNIIGSSLSTLGEDAVNATKSLFSDTPPQHPSGPGYWKDVTTMGGVGGKGGGAGVQKSRVWVSTAAHPQDTSLWHQATHAAFSVVNNLFDTPQHMYRAAVLAYRKHGWDGVAAILAPAIAGAAAGSLVGNPELGVATGEAGVAAGAAGEAAAGAAGEAAAGGAAAGAGEAAAAGTTTAGTTAGVTDAATEEAAAQAATRTAEAASNRVVPTVAEEAQMAGVRRGAQMLMDSPLGKASKLIGSPIKAVTDALTSPTMAGFQTPDQAFYLSNNEIGNIWHEAKSPTKDLSTIGRGLSQEIFGKQNTWLSGTTDAIASLVAAPYEFGRALKSSESMGRILTAVDSTSVDTAFWKSPGYRRALGEVASMANGTMGEEVKNNIAGAIVRAMPTLEPIAKDVADAARAEVEKAAKEGRNVDLYQISKRIGELADQGMMTKTNLLPTMGIYGAFKTAGKLSDNYIPSRVSRILGQSPMAIDDIKQIMTTGTIRLGEPNAAYKLGQLLQQTGMKSSDITRLVNDLVTSRDLTKWENLTKNALKENFFNIIDQRMMKALGFDTEEWHKAFGSGLLSPEQAEEVDRALGQRGFQTTYTAMRDSIHKAVDNMVGNSSAGGPSGLFVLDADGKNVSNLRDGRSAAVTENQRGELNLPNYHQFAQELDKMFSNMKDINSGAANFHDTISGAALRTNHSIDLWVNDRFFKPLALLTPGWALRVSLSELALNVTRLGPGNLLAGAVTRSMIKSERKAFAIAQKQAANHIKDLEARVSEVRQEIARLDQQEKGFVKDTRRFTGQTMDQPTRSSDAKHEELQALLDHIEWSKSHVGTPEPTMGSGMGNEADRFDIGKTSGFTAPPRTTPQMPPDEIGVLRVSDYLRDRGYNIDPVEAHNLHMIARGIYIGMKQAVLHGIGKDEFINAASYLMYRHGGYLPPAVDSVHKSMLSNVDMAGDYVGVDKVGGQKEIDPVTGKEIQKPKTYKVGSRKGEIKTKMVLMSPHDFAMSQFGGKGYFEGWHYSANTLAQSQYLGRPLADAYKGFLDAGMEGEELHNAAILAARKIIQECPADIRETMARSVGIGTGHIETMDPIQSWAGRLVDKLEGIAAPREAIDQTAKEVERGVQRESHLYSPHYELIRDIAKGDVGIHTNEFYERYAFQEDGQPMERRFFPNTVISRSPQFYQTRDVLSKLSTMGHQKFLGPMVNYLSRQPTYIADFVLERKKLDEAIARGTITADQADVIAETTATRRMSRFIHNPEDKTKFEEMMSTAAPFYFAQNQAWRRMGRLFAENPGAFMQYAGLMMGVQQLVSDATNQNGMAIKTIPALAMYGMPFTASLSSLQTMDPFSTTEDMASPSGKGQTLLDWIEPKFGPVVSVPTKLLYWMDPGLEKSKAGQFAERQLAGQIGTDETTSQFMFQSAIPNSLVRSLIEIPVGQAMGGAGIRGTTANFLDNAYLQAEMESARYLVSSESEKYWNSLRNDKNLTPLQRAEDFYAWQAKRWSSNTAEGVRTTQALLDEARRRASITWLAKIGLGFGSPVSISIGQSDAPMITKLNNYVKDPKYKGNYMKAVDAFTKDNPWATIDTISKSKSVYGGYYPATKTMYDWLSTHEDLAREHPLAAMALAPDLTKDTQYYQPANTLLLNLGLRARQSPQDFVDSWLVSSGNAFYYNWIKPTYDQMRGDSRYSSSAAYKWRQSMIDWYGQNYNNTWLSNYNSSQGTTRKLQAIAQFTDMAAKTPNDPVTQGLMELRNQIMGTDNRNGVYQQLQLAIRSGRTNSADAQYWWQQWMDEWIAYDPRLKQGILSLFYNLG